MLPLSPSITDPSWTERVGRVAEAEIGAAIGVTSGAHMLPPDQAAASASQVVAAR